MNTFKNIGIALFLGILLYGGYAFFLKGTPSPDSILVTSGDGALDESGNPIPGSELLQTLEEMHSVKLDISIFSSPLFRALKDFGVVIREDQSQVGRPNPFAQIGAIAPVVPPVSVLPAKTPAKNSPTVKQAPVNTPADEDLFDTSGTDDIPTDFGN